MLEELAASVDRQPCYHIAWGGRGHLERYQDLMPDDAILALLCSPRGEHARQALPSGRRGRGGREAALPFC